MRSYCKKELPLLIFFFFLLLFLIIDEDLLAKKYSPKGRYKGKKM